MEGIKEWMKNPRNVVVLGIINATILYIAKFWIYCYANHSVAIGLGMSVLNGISLLGIIVYLNSVLFGMKEEKETNKIAKWVLLITALCDFAITMVRMVRIGTTPNFYPGYLAEQIVHFFVMSTCIWYFIHTIFRGKTGRGNVVLVITILADVVYNIILGILVVNDINVIALMFDLLALGILPYFYQIRKERIGKEPAREIVGFL